MARRSVSAARAGGLSPSFALERALFREGVRSAAGVDEVGRGALAGPLVAAAIVLPQDLSGLPAGVRDSKTLSAERREALFADLAACASFGAAFIPAREVDRLNVRGATLLAMRRAVAALPEAPDFVLIDGRDVPEGLPCEARAIVKGDATCLSIAAASIIAKVLRDRLMRTQAFFFAGDFFEKNVGYGVAAHLRAVTRLGPCALHRLSFAPFKNETARAQRTKGK